MQLHTITFRGLGPFKDEQHVDFSHLTESGLFLLEGPTGSGKSTLIDAIVFALYGGVASQAADKDRLVSHYLPDGVQPFVELVFETTSGIYRVRRAPAYERSKVRGQGTTTEHTSVALTRLTSPDSDDGEVLSTRIGEADSEITAAIGLTKDQFVGTVILPQGEFASFLRSDVKDRGAILQRIFRTDLFKRLQDRLWNLSGDARRRRTEADNTVGIAVGTFTGAAGLGDTLPGWDSNPADTEQLDEAVAAATRRLDEELEQLRLRREVTAKTLDEARSHEEAAQARVTLRDRRRDAENRQSALEAESADYARWKEQFDRAERAARVADAISAHAQAEQSLDSAGEAVARHRRGLAPEHADLPPAGLQEALTLTNEIVVGIRPLVAVEEGLAERGRLLEDLGRRRTRVHGDVQDLKARADVIPAEMDGARKDRDARLAEAALVNNLEASQEQARQRLDLLDSLQTARARWEQAVAAASAAGAEAARGAARLADVRQRHASGMAAELAQGLEPGQACLVCGSLEHPSPAVPSLGHVSAEDVQDADAAYARIASSERDLLAAAQREEVVVVGLEAQLEGRTEEAIRSDLAEASARLAAAQESLARADGLALVLERLGAELDRAMQRVEEHSAEEARLATEIAHASEGLDEDQKRVDLARQSFPSVADRVLSLEKAASSLGVAHEAVRAQAAATDDVRHREESMRSALEREGFPDRASARSATMEEEALEGLGGRIATYGQERAIVAEKLAAPELQGVDPDEEIDLAAAKRSRIQAGERALDAEKAYASADTQHQKAASTAAAVAKASNGRTRLYDDTEALIGVARLAKGDSPLSMDLATFVLQQRFEAVVAAANDHLRVMSDGQLMLQAHEEAEGRARRAGLGLRIIDLRTDSARPTGTLSGGETFYTALSLALGLADVVTGEAGGIGLETLFVDEGFGSLDGDTLDDVLRVLTSLRDAGRSVGVVSHVDELKDRISERIQVRRDDERGPSQLTVVA